MQVHIYTYTPKHKPAMPVEDYFCFNHPLFTTLTHFQKIIHEGFFLHLLIVMKRSTETNGSKKPCLLNLDKYPQASMTPLSFCSIAHIYARSQPKELPDAPVQSCYFEFDIIKCQHFQFRLNLCSN